MRNEKHQETQPLYGLLKFWLPNLPFISVFEESSSNSAFFSSFYL